MMEAHTAAISTVATAAETDDVKEPVCWRLPDAPAVLYRGHVMHMRVKPVAHRFRYRVFNLCLDLDRLTEANHSSALFSINRLNLVSFHERDHVDGVHPSLRAYADSLMAAAGIRERAARIALVCYPRILGYGFNPISVYYAYRADGSLLTMIYEVRNTFGDRHTYVCPVASGDVSAAGIRQERNKIFHVSPFIPMDMRYYFRMLPPEEEIRWRILETDAEGPLLAATFSGERRPLTTLDLVRSLAWAPLLTLKIIGAIHVEAFRLWRKGVRPLARPEPPAKVSFTDTDRDTRTTTS